VKKFQFWLNGFVKKKTVKVIGFILAACFLAIFTYKCVKDNIENDFHIYYQSAMAAVETGDIYSVPGNFYPLFSSLFITPFLLFGLKGAAAVWFFVNIGALWACIVLCLYIVTGKTKNLKLRYYILPALLAFRPIESNFTNGQINLMILLLVLSGLALFKKKKDILCGILLACAVAVKLTPLIFLPYFLYKKAFRAATGMLIGLVIFLGLIPSAVWGPEKTLDLMKQNMTLIHSFKDATVHFGYAPGQSGTVLIQNLLSKTNTIPSRYQNKSYYPMHINIMELDKGQLTLVGRFLFLILAAALVLLLRSDARDRTSSALPMEWSFLIITMLMVSPLSRKAHFVSLMLPFMVLICYKDYFINWKRLHFFIKFSLIAGFVMINLTAPGLMGRHMSLYFNSYCPLLISALFCFTSIVLIKIKLGKMQTQAIPIPHMDQEIKEIA